MTPFYLYASFSFKMFSSIFRMIRRNSSSLFPVGSSNPQSASKPLPMKGQLTLQPMEMATSGAGISEISLEYWVCSFVWDRLLP